MHCWRIVCIYSALCFHTPALWRRNITVADPWVRLEAVRKEYRLKNPNVSGQWDNNQAFEEVWTTPHSATKLGICQSHEFSDVGWPARSKCVSSWSFSSTLMASRLRIFLGLVILTCVCTMVCVETMILGPKFSPDDLISQGFRLLSQFKIPSMDSAFCAPISIFLVWDLLLSARVWFPSSQQIELAKSAVRKAAALSFTAGHDRSLHHYDAPAPLAHTILRPHEVTKWNDALRVTKSWKCSVQCSRLNDYINNGSTHHCFFSRVFKQTPWTDEKEEEEVSETFHSATWSLLHGQLLTSLKANVGDQLEAP